MMIFSRDHVTTSSKGDTTAIVNLWGNNDPQLLTLFDIWLTMMLGNGEQPTLMVNGGLC